MNAVVRSWAVRAILLIWSAFFLVSPALAAGISAPAGLKAVSDGKGTVAVSWGAVPGASHYALYRGGAPGKEEAAPVYEGTDTSYTDAGASGGENYYQVIAIAGGFGVPETLSSRSAEVMAAGVPVPTGLKAVSDGKGTVAVSWGAVPGASHYALYRGGAPGKEEAAPVYEGTGTSYSDTGAAAGVSYYQVIAIAGSGSTEKLSARSVEASTKSTDSAGQGGVTSNPAANPPGADNACHFVLTTIKNASGQGITDCNNVSFKVYLASLLDGLLPYVLLLSIISIVYSGLQYMLASAGAGDVKAARQRVLGILTGVVFYFLVRLILNQLAPGISF